MAKKKSDEKDLELEKEVKNLAFGYIFLMVSFIIFFVVLHSFNFYLFDTKLNYSIFILPFILFMEDAILKEVGYKYGVEALVFSSIILFLTSIGTDYILNVDFDLVKHIGIVLAYIISQFVNMLIYYYMLDNYRTPYFFVVANMMFSILIYNMFYMLFSLGLVFTSDFWYSYTIVAIIQTLLSMICGILLNIIKQGVDKEY